MLSLDNKIWKEVEGGYRILYNASVPLSQLEQTNDPDKINTIFQELWDELHHQGDVGLASYLAIPQLVRIGINKGLFDWNILGLCCIIEIERHAEKNPALPPEYYEYYSKGIEELKRFVLTSIATETDETTYRLALSALAICDGRIKIGKAIMELEDDILDEFLEQF